MWLLKSSRIMIKVVTESSAISQKPKIFKEWWELTQRVQKESFKVSFLVSQGIMALLLLPWKRPALNCRDRWCLFLLPVLWRRFWPVIPPSGKRAGPLSPFFPQTPKFLTFIWRNASFNIDVMYDAYRRYLTEISFDEHLPKMALRQSSQIWKEMCFPGSTISNNYSYVTTLCPHGLYSL